MRFQNGRFVERILPFSTTMAIEVVCAFIFKDDQIWMGRRPDHKHMGGKWEFPGGKIDEGEDAKTALKRELSEELGIQITVGDVVAEVTHEYPNKVIHLRAFRVSTNNDPQLIEHTEGQWIPINTSDYLDWASADIDLWQTFHRARRAQ